MVIVVLYDAVLLKLALTLLIVIFLVRIALTRIERPHERVVLRAARWRDTQLLSFCMVDHVGHPHCLLSVVGTLRADQVFTLPVLIFCHARSISSSLVSGPLTSTRILFTSASFCRHM